MTIRTSLFAALGVFTLAACSANSGSDSNLRSGPSAGSGGMAGIPSGSGGSGAGLNLLPMDAGVSSGGGDGVLNGVCAQQDFDLQRKPAEILLVLDRSASMKDPPKGSSGASKWELVVPGVNEVVTATNAGVSWGLKVFPEGEGSECVAGSVTAAIPVKIAPMDAKAVTDAVTATLPNGNGTPTGDAINAAVTYLKSLTDTNPKFILLATDGEPSCNGTSKDSTGARTQAVQAVTAAAAAGVKTFVVGVATTKPTATQALNDMAVAGQMPRADTNPLANKFYLASTKDELVSSLETITGQVSSCVFSLTVAPPDPTNIAVLVNNTSVPQDTTRVAGWDYTSKDNTEVEVFGTWCDQIKAAAANSVTFKLGCPGEVVH